MLPYILMFSFISLSPFLSKSVLRSKSETSFLALKLSMFVLFLVFSLRAPSVGRDIPGYVNMYNSFTHASFDSFNLYWTERGYNFIELIANKYLNLSWQSFLAIIYGSITISYYHFFKRYSYNPIYSLIVYLLLGYFILDLSALRTAIALSICLYAVPFAQKKDIKSLFIYILIVILAAQFQRGAYIFLMLYFVQRIILNMYTIIIAFILPVFVFLFRTQIMKFLIANFRHNGTDSGVGIGGSVVMYTAIVLFSSAVLYFYKKRKNQQAQVDITKNEELYQNVSMPIKMLYFGVLLQVFLGQIALVRMAQFGLFFTTVLIPNTLNMLDNKSKRIFYVLITSLLILFFYFFKYLVNELDFLPYVPFWEYTF